MMQAAKWKPGCGTWPLLPGLRMMSKAGTVRAPKEQRTPPWLPARPHTPEFMRKKVKSNPRFPVLSHSPPASATEPSLTSRRTAPEWLSLWFQINPSLQAKGLNSIWRSARRGEGGEEEWGRQQTEGNPFQTPRKWAELKRVKNMPRLLLWPIRNWPKTQIIHVCKEKKILELFKGSSVVLCRSTVT